MMDNVDFNTFKVNIQRNKPGEREFKVSNSWGAYDAYKHMRKHKWYDIGRAVKEKEFYAIIRGINDLLADEVALGKTVMFPSRMGKLELRKVETGVQIVDGKLRIKYPVNWHETLQLWFEDEEARKNKTLIRNECRTLYFVKYSKYEANFPNKMYYEFALNRYIKKALSKNVKKGILETLW